MSYHFCSKPPFDKTNHKQNYILQILKRHSSFLSSPVLLELHHSDDRSLLQKRQTDTSQEQLNKLLGPSPREMTRSNAMTKSLSAQSKDREKKTFGVVSRNQSFMVKSGQSKIPKRNRASLQER